MPQAKEAEIVNYVKYDKIPKRDPITKQNLPLPEPEEVDRSDWEYITIPERDIFDKPFQGIGLNGIKFERGHKYFVSPDVAAELTRILAVAQKADLRILQSHPDVKAVEDQSRYGTGAGGSTFNRSF